MPSLHIPAGEVIKHQDESQVRPGRTWLSVVLEERNMSLYSQLQQYTGQGLYPFHMPGHKRSLSPAPGLPYSWDMTEVEGVDDLHHAEGILKDAMARTAKLFGSRRTWYLVGGSTCGILAMIRAATPLGSEMIVARNCHKSVYHAIELGNLDVHWMAPPIDEAFEVCGSIPPEEVERQILKYPDSRAVVITSPTYEGVISDIGAIAKICHAHGTALLVDEAHGAHLGLFGQFPAGAVALGADVVVQSAHKTLPSLTQTALLHVNSALLADEAIEQQLSIFETSSPSYPLLASLDGCTEILQKDGAQLFRAWRERLARFDCDVQGLERLQVMCYGGDTACAKAKAQGSTDSADCGHEEPGTNHTGSGDGIGNHPFFYDFDPSKLLIRAPLGMTGGVLADILRKEYGIETEMHSGRNVLAMTSCADTDKGFERLTKALLELDKKLGEYTGKLESAREKLHLTAPIPRAACRIGEAVLRPKEPVTEAEAVGRISAEYIYPYPPGVPVLVPGEEITREALGQLEILRQHGAQMIHSSGEEDESGIIWVVM